MYLSRYYVQCKRYNPNSKSITHLSNVKIRVVHIHYVYRKHIGKQISIDLSKYVCTIYAYFLSIYRFQRCKMYTNTLDKHRWHIFEVNVIKYQVYKFYFVYKKRYNNEMKCELNRKKRSDFPPQIHFIYFDIPLIWYYLVAFFCFM